MRRLNTGRWPAEWSPRLDPGGRGPLLTACARARTLQQGGGAPRTSLFQRFSDARSWLSPAVRCHVGSVGPGWSEAATACWWAAGRRRDSRSCNARGRRGRDKQETCFADERRRLTAATGNVPPEISNAQHSPVSMMLI